MKGSSWLRLVQQTLQTESFKKGPEPRAAVLTLDPSTQEAGPPGLCEFQASLFYIKSTRPARLYIQWDAASTLMIVEVMVVIKKKWWRRWWGWLESTYRCVLMCVYVWVWACVYGLCMCVLYCMCTVCMQVCVYVWACANRLCSACVICIVYVPLLCMCVYIINKLTTSLLNSEGKWGYKWHLHSPTMLSAQAYTSVDGEIWSNGAKSRTENINSCAEIWGRGLLGK